MTKIALVGCGASKKKGSHRAEDLYTSNYFQLKKEFAQKVCDKWFILSAKYGLIVNPETKEISSYDKTLKDMDEEETEEWARDIAQHLHSVTDELDSGSTMYWLAGKDYVKPVERLVMDDVVDPFEPMSSLPFRMTSGIGEQMAWLKDKIEDEDIEENQGQQEIGDFL